MADRHAGVGSAASSISLLLDFPFSVLVNCAMVVNLKLAIEWMIIVVREAPAEQNNKQNGDTEHA